MTCIRTTSSDRDIFQNQRETAGFQEFGFDLGAKALVYIESLWLKCRMTLAAIARQTYIERNMFNP